MKIVYHTKDGQTHKDCPFNYDDQALCAMFGRMNPPTLAHMNIIEHMERAFPGGNLPLIVVSDTSGNDTNPLSAELRKLLLNTWCGSHVTNAKDLFAAAGIAGDILQSQNIYDGVTKNVLWFVGTDRLEGIKRLWLYPDNFQQINIVIAEVIRDVDSEQNISASAMRAAVLNNDRETFDNMSAFSPDAFGEFDPNLANDVMWKQIETVQQYGSLESKVKTTK